MKQKPHSILFAALFILSCILSASSAFAQKDFTDNRVIISLLKAEKDFAEKSNDLGQQKAFMKVMAPDAILFRPKAVNGPEFIKNKKDFKGVLTWSPTWAEVSHDGHFGYTTGPYTFMLGDSSYYGEYVSIWKRTPYKDDWELFVDAGVSHKKPLLPIEALSYPHTTTTRYPKIYPTVIDESKDILLTSDVIFATLLSTRSVAKAYRVYLSPDARLLKDGQMPVRGIDSIISNLTKQKGSFRTIATGAFVSFSRDLGFTYGTGEFIDAYRKKPKDNRFNYLRIWRKAADGLWRIVVEMQMAAK